MVRPDSRTDHIEEALHQKVVGDLSDAKALRRMAECADVLVHIAFEAATDQPMRLFRADVLGSLQLLELCRQSGVSQLVYISSIKVYNTVFNDRLLDERHAALPGDLTGAAKAAVESFLLAYHEIHAMNTSALRLACVYGMHHRWRDSWNYDVVNAVTLGEEVDTAHGGYVVHVDDVADAVVAAVGNYSVGGQVFNLVDEYVFDQDVAKIAREMTGSPSVIYDRKSEITPHHFVNGKCDEILGVSPNRGDDGVRAYVRELLDKFV
jgi:nucleoside-diphosphate-sugar epimerase